MLIGNVAADFAGLAITLAHPWFPWQDEARRATHKPGVRMGQSGWSPEYSPPQLAQHANSLLQDTVMFGSDSPLLTPDRWPAGFAELAINPALRERVPEVNAARQPGLTAG